MADWMRRVDAAALITFFLTATTLVILFPGCGLSLSGYRERALEICRGIESNFGNISERMDEIRKARELVESLEQSRDLANAYSEAQDMAWGARRGIKQAREELRDIGVPKEAERVHRDLVDFLAKADAALEEVGGAMWAGSAITRVDNAFDSSLEKLQGIQAGAPREEHLEVLQQVIDDISKSMDCFEGETLPAETSEGRELKQLLSSALKTRKASFEDYRSYVESGDESYEEEAEAKGREASGQLDQSAVVAEQINGKAMDGFQRAANELQVIVSILSSLG